MGTLKQRRDALVDRAFVGRRHELQLFTDCLSAESPPWVVLNVFGIGGVGKSALLKRFVAACRTSETPVPVALIDARLSGTWLSALKAALEHLGRTQHFSGFEHNIRLYFDLEKQIRSAFQSAGDAALSAVKSGVPFGIGQGVVDLVGEERVRTWLYRNVSADNAELFLDAERLITESFVNGLNRRIVETGRAVLMFDDFRSGTALDQWLRVRVLDGNMDDRTMIVIAGRDALQEGWEDWSHLTCGLQLDVLAESEAFELLSRRGITDAVAGDIVRQSGRVPLTLGVMADAFQEDQRVDAGDAAAPGNVGATRDRIARRFLDHVADERLRMLVESAALLRIFDQDSLRAVAGEVSLAEWNRLVSFSFVRRRQQGYAIHDVVREVVLVALAEREPDRRRAMHRRAADMYERRHRESLRQDARSAVEWLYHLSHVDEPSVLDALSRLMEPSIAVRDPLAESVLHELEPLLTSPRARATVALYRSMIAMAKGEWARAAELLAHLEGSPHLTAAQRNHASQFEALALRYMGELERAIVVAERYVAAKVNDPDRRSLAANLTNLAELYGLRGQLTMAESRLRESLAVLGDAGDPLERMKALLYLDHCYRWQGRWAKALEQSDLVVRLAGEHGDDWSMARARYGRGRALTYVGSAAEASRELNAALTLFKSKDALQHVAETLSGLAILHMEQEQWTEAEQYVTQSEEQFRRLGAQLYVCWATLNKGELFRRRGMPDAALPLLNKGLQDARRMHYVLGECLALISLGETFEALGERALAEQQLANAFELASTTGYNFDRARAMIHLARVRHVAGDESSHDLLAEALRIADECGFRLYAERLAYRS